ncbi:MAG: hypothetical protein AAF564_17595 [Bacteroidota bacterium]
MTYSGNIQSRILLTLCLIMVGTNSSCNPAPSSEMLRVGASELVITPELGETYLDYNGNNRWEDDEPYDDANGNGRFDPLWIANDVRRPALAIQDDLYVNAVVFEYGGKRIGMFGLDTFGHSFTELELIRSHRDYPGLGLDMVIMGSSHTHEGPDTVGIYGPSTVESGVDETYMAFVRDKVVEALVNAVASLQLATMESATLNTGLDTYQIDQRDPVIIDDQLAVIRFKSVSHNHVLSTLINWASHPEQVIDGVSISSDYVGAWREAQKARHPDAVPVFFQGALGGQIGSNNIAFSYQDSTFEACGQCSYEKAGALGNILSDLTEQALETGQTVDVPAIEHRSAAVLLPLEHPGFQALFNAGTIKRQLFDATGTAISDAVVPGETATYLKSEMVYLRIGDVSMLSVPGELHPELAIGGYDGSATPGGFDALWSVNNTGIEDLSQAPAPPYLRDLLDTRVRMILGVTQDFTGYIIPAFNFDLHPTTPYLDSHDWDHHYEETNALSPKMAEVVHQTAVKLVQ